MSDFFNRPTVGIDVSADFSIVAILAPDGHVLRKPFKVSHDFESFSYLSSQIKEVEKAYGMKTGIFMESTGVYHISLFHFLNSEFDTYIINPLITNSNKNNEIRKVKNDKKDSLAIARLGKFHNLKTSSVVDVNIFTLKTLLRDYFKIVDFASAYKKKLYADLRIVFPNYLSVFSNPVLPTSIAILNRYPTPDAVLNAPKEDLMSLLMLSKKGASWSNQKLKKLIAAAES
jgi:transposase